MEVVDLTRPQRAAVAAIAAALLVTGLSAAGSPAPDVPDGVPAGIPAAVGTEHDPRVTVSGTAIPLPDDTAVLVLDVDGVEHGRALADALGPTAVALDARVGVGVGVDGVPHLDGVEGLLPDQASPLDDPATPVVVVDRHREGVDAQECLPVVDAAALAARIAEQHPVTVLVVDAAQATPLEPSAPPVPPVPSADPVPPVPPVDDVPAPVAPTVVHVLDPGVDDTALADVLRGVTPAAPFVDLPEPALSSAAPSAPTPPQTPLPVPSPTCPPEPGSTPTGAPADPTPTEPTEPTPTEPLPTEPTATESTATVPPSAEPSAAPAGPPSTAGPSPAGPPAPTTPWRLPARAAAPGLALAVDGAAVHLSDAVDAADRWRLSGLLTGVRVVDARTTQPGRGWTLAAQVSDLTGPATLPAGRVGWVPQVGDARAAAGPAVAGTLSGGPGLAVPALLASADRATSGAPVELDAELVLETPRDTPPGTYSGTLTLTLFPEE